VSSLDPFEPQSFPVCWVSPVHPSPLYLFMQTVQVKLAERSYPIFIGTNTQPLLAETLGALLPHWTHCLLVCDSNVCETVGRTVGSLLEADGKRMGIIVVPNGEGSKSVEQLANLWHQMLEQRSDRKTLVIAIGGGVVGDLAGFAAASYSRGLRFIQIPTTLLAMVDSSVGGKTGINLPTAKNMIGAFWQPHAVWIDTASLDSLPDREYRSGLAEVVKYGVILDPTLFQYLEQNADAILNRDQTSVQHIVRRSCELKAQVVSLDEREMTGLRAILNYGHTFGHAIEASTAYGQYLHGEAIAIGMNMAGRLAARIGLWSSDCVDRQSQLLHRFGLPTECKEVSAEPLVAAMQMDKKTEHGQLHFILPTQIGQVKTVSNCERADIIAAIGNSGSKHE